MLGGLGRVIWFPTFDSENAVRKSKENRPFVPIVKDGRLLPEVLKRGVVLRLKTNAGITGWGYSKDLPKFAGKTFRERFLQSGSLLPPVNPFPTKMTLGSSALSMTPRQYERLSDAWNLGKL